MTLRTAQRAQERETAKRQAGVYLLCPGCKGDGTRLFPFDQRCELAPEHSEYRFTTQRDAKANA